MIYAEASYPFPGTIPHQFQHIADWEREGLRQHRMRWASMPRVSRPVRCDDATRFPNIAAAVAELDAMPAGRRAELEKDWK